MDIETLKTKERNTRLKWKHDIASLFCAHKIIEHKNTEEAYAHLENNAVVLEIVNPYRKENLYRDRGRNYGIFQWLARALRSI